MPDPDEKPRPTTPIDASALPAVKAPASRGFFAGLTPAGRWAIGVALVLAVGLAASFGWQPVYKRIKVWRAVRMARQAEQSLDAGDLATASRVARTTIRMAPAAPEVNRLVARVSARIGDASGIARWREVLGSGIATRDDWIEASRMAIQFGRVDLSDAWLRDAIQRFPNDVTFHILSIRHFLRLGDRPRAIQFARQCLRKFPSDPEVEYETGRVFASGAEPALRAEGRRLLWDIAAGNSVYRDLAVDALSAGRELGKSETEALVRLIEAGPARSPGLKLLALDLRSQLDPTNRAACIRAAIDLVPEATNAAVLGRIVAWLNRNGGIAAALPVFSIERCRTNPMLMAGRLDALIATGRTNEIEAIAAQSTDPVNQLLVQAARGVVAVASGRRADGEAAFRQVVRARPRVGAVLSFVATRAEAVGMRDVAMEANEAAMAIPGMTLDSGRSLLRLSRSLDDLTTCRKALRGLNAFIPGDEVVAAERAWVEVVFGDEKEFSAMALGHMARSRTNQPSWRFGEALAIWRKGDAAGALSLMESGGVRWEALEPRSQMAYVAVLGANNQREAARRFARQIDPKKLHAQERALIDPYL